MGGSGTSSTQCHVLGRCIGQLSSGDCVPLLSKAMIFSLSTEENVPLPSPGSAKTSINFQFPINSVFELESSSLLQENKIPIVIKIKNAFFIIIVFSEAGGADGGGREAAGHDPLGTPL